MPRIARKDMESQFFHIVVQGIDKEYIFNETRYKEKYKELLEKYVYENNISILAYCIMDNHAHILIYYKNVKNMSRFMHSVNTSYGYYYNNIKDRVGIVFRNRYSSEPIFNEKHLYNCIKYIHNNPVKANIAKSSTEYKHSSCNEYMHDTNGLITDTGIGYNYIKGYKEAILSGNDYKFIDYINKDIDVNYEIEKYCKDRNIVNILKDKSQLIDMLKYLVDMKITKGDIAKELNMSRVTVTKLLKRSVPNVQK